MDDNANKLAKRVQKSEINLKNAAVGEFQKMNRILETCQLCHHPERNQPPVAPLLSLGTRVYLTLPTEPELSDGGAVIVPIELWREIESERETAYLLKSSNMKNRLLDAMKRDEGIPFEAVVAKLGV